MCLVGNGSQKIREGLSEKTACQQQGTEESQRTEEHRVVQGRILQVKEEPVQTESPRWEFALRKARPMWLRQFVPRRKGSGGSEGSGRPEHFGAFPQSRQEEQRCKMLVRMLDIMRLYYFSPSYDEASFLNQEQMLKIADSSMKNALLENGSRRQLNSDPYVCSFLFM